MQRVLVCACAKYICVDKRQLKIQTINEREKTHRIVKGERIATTYTRGATI